MIRWFGGLRPFRPAGAAGGTDSWVGTPELFARQRRIGFAGLRFVPRLERDYRRRFAGAHATRVTVLHLLGIVSMLLFVWFDQCVAAQALDVLGGSLLLVMGLGLAVPIIIARSRWRVVARQSGLTLGLLVANLALVALIFVLRRDDGLFPQESLLLASLYTYFMSALPLRYAVLCALVPSGVHALLTVQGLNVTPQFLPYELFYLGLANVFGITGRYLTEHQERSLYLLRLARSGPMRNRSGRWRRAVGCRWGWPSTTLTTSSRSMTSMVTPPVMRCWWRWRKPLRTMRAGWSTVWGGWAVTSLSGSGVSAPRPIFIACRRS